MDLSWNREHIPRPFHAPMNCEMEPRRYEEELLQKRSPENPPPSPVLVKSHAAKLLHVQRLRTEMILKRKMPTSAEEERIIVEMPRVEVDVVTRSLDTAQTAITRIERKFSKDTSLQGCRMSFTDKS